MSRFRTRSQSLCSSHASRVGRRSLRLESLEPRLVLSAGLTAGLSASKLSAAAVTVGATADAYVSSTSPWTNYGNATDLLVARNGGFNGGATAAYLKFDLAGVSGTVDKAVLNLTPISVSGNGSVTICIQLLRDSNDGWVEGTGGQNNKGTGPVTWANSPYGYGLMLTLPASQFRKGVAAAIDVTRLIQQSFNANGIAGFLVQIAPQSPGFGGGGTASIDFASDENATAGYRPTLTVTTSGGTPLGNAPTVASQPAATNQTSTSVSLSVKGADTEDAESALRYTWSVKTPNGATAPTFGANGTNAASNTTVTFHDAGVYQFTATITDTSGLSVAGNTITVTVGQVLTGLSVSPSSVTLALGGSQTFTAAGADQFGDVMTLTSGNVTWIATKGTCSSSTGTTITYVAPSAASSATVTASCGTLSAAATVTVVQSNFLGLYDATLASLTQSLDADGSLSRNDMIAILNSVKNESDGIVDSQDMHDLKAIISSASTLNVPGYVVVLANDIVNGSAANAKYQGAALGNLAVGNSAAKLGKLIDKWFYGGDLPSAGSYSYDTSTSGTLYGTSNSPSHVDEHQGDLGDCYLLTGLGTIADSSASALKNMIISNGDGTWTVRFYYNGVADYVTVNSRLPVDSSGKLVYDGYGTSSTSGNNVLWLELLEKAYAQWNETGRTQRGSASNSYADIEGGWMGDVYQQALGYAPTTYSASTSSSSAQQSLVNAISAHQAVSIGTKSFNYNATTGLYGNHAYAVIAYNSSTGKFTLYNPWGSDQPSQLTWSQLKQFCDAFSATATTGSGSGTLAAGKANSLIAPPIAVPLTPATTSQLSPVKGNPAPLPAGERVVLAAAVEVVFGDAAYNEGFLNRTDKPVWSKADSACGDGQSSDELTLAGEAQLSRIDAAIAV
jgi:hypothetical protein